MVELQLLLDFLSELIPTNCMSENEAFKQI